LRLTVANAEKATKGWDAAIDNGAAEPHTGSSAVMRNIPPGKHIVTVRAEIDGERKSMRRSFVVIGGEEAHVEVVL
jgi:hypothetical protein